MTVSRLSYITAIKNAALQSWRSHKIRWLVVVFIATSLLFLINSVLTYQGATSLVNHDRDVIHIQSVLSHLKTVFTTIDDAETGQRGYILSGKLTYLQPYLDANAQIAGQETRLQRLLRGDGPQQAQMQILQQLISTKFTELQTTLNLYKQGQVQQALILILSDQGQQTMDGIRQHVTQMETYETKLLTVRNADAQAQLGKTVFTDIFGALANIALLAFAFFLSIRIIRERERIAVQQQQLFEREQNARQEAEAAVQTRDQFLSIAAHEIKTPLTTLMINFQMAQRRQLREGEVNQRQRQQWEIVTEQMSRLRSLTDLVFDISRLDSGKLRIEHDMVDVTALVARVVAATQPTTECHTLVLEKAEMPLVVTGDALRLEQVLNNLLQNAIKYSPDGGAVTVRIHACDAEVWLSVRDDGIGIPASDLPRLYERFYRASNADPTHINGLGIGLYVANEIVALHGGRIQVTSVEGQGSCFTVQLPLCEVARVAV